MIEGPDGWRLAPEGAAVHPVERVAVIADVHLGYEWARAAGGDCLPSHSLAETLVKLGRLLGRVPDRSPGGRRRPRRVAEALPADGLGPPGAVRVAGRPGRRADPRAGEPRPPGTKAPPSTFEVAGWTVAHGHRPIAGDKTISGHHHPVLRADGLTAPCFLFGPNTIVLPAFTPNAAGLPVGSAGTPGRWLADKLRCVAGLDDQLLDFGPLPELVASLRG